MRRAGPAESIFLPPVLRANYPAGQEDPIPEMGFIFSVCEGAVLISSFVETSWPAMRAAALARWQITFSGGLLAGI